MKTGYSIREVSEHMLRLHRASGISVQEAFRRLQEQGPPPPARWSPEEWRRACELSQRRAEERRGVSPHPWPADGHVMATILVALVVIAVIWIVLVSMWGALS